MLVLSRKRGEQLVIGSDITVTVVECNGNRIKIGIEAPDYIRIVRGELNAIPCPAPTGGFGTMEEFEAVLVGNPR
ncbi:MAG: carbon storage regulator [Planctomycetes bacterium]|nr:carbon storage regulator [Planctomycetota bacterium]